MSKTEKPKSTKLFTFWWAVRLDLNSGEEIIKLEIEADSEESALSLASQTVIAKSPLYHYYTNKFQVSKAVK